MPPFRAKMEGAAKCCLLKQPEGECLLTTVMSSRVDPRQLYLGTLTSPLMNGGDQFQFITHKKSISSGFECLSVHGLFRRGFLDLSQERISKFQYLEFLESNSFSHM